MFKKLEQWLFPPFCCLCEHPAEASVDLCKKCKNSLPWLLDRCFQCGLPLEGTIEHIRCQRCLESPPPFHRLCGLLNYDFPATALITRLKFGKRLAYGRILGELLAEKVCHEWYKGIDLPQAVLPVPLHAERLRERGFNQSLELLLPLQKYVSLPILLDECVRLRKTQPQSKLGKNVRKRNMKSAFQILTPIHLEHVAIVDDVVTTGSTVSAISWLLREQKVQQIDVWCICRA